MPSPDLSLALSRIGRAAGLAPLVLAPLLVACDAVDADRAEIDATGPSIDDSDRVPDAPMVLADTVNPPAPVGPAEVEGDPPDVVALRPHLTIHGLVTPGHVVEIEVRAVPPGSVLSLQVGITGGETAFGNGALAMVEARTLEAVDAGIDGVERVRVLVPEGLAELLDDGVELVLQPVVTTEDGQTIIGREWVGGPQAVLPDWADFEELHPRFPVGDVVGNLQARACMPADAAGDCALIADFHEWQALELAAFALDQPLPAAINANACIEETAFTGSCCYIVEFWEAGVQTIDDTCLPPNAGNNNNNNNGGGGGGGGGWDWYDGRPFQTDTGRRESAAVSSSTWSNAPWSSTPVRTDELPADLRDAVVSTWTATARAEHASVASFSRFVLELMALGAPAELVAWATRAQADEIRHAELAFGIASAYAEQPIGPGAFDLTGALDRSTDVEAVLTGAIVEGCINETIASLQVRDAAAHAADPVLRAQLDQVADDELTHAELSWAFVRWLLAQHPELAPVARAAFDDFATDAPAPTTGPDLSRWGVRPQATQLALAAEALEHVVRPAAAALLATLPVVAEA